MKKTLFLSLLMLAALAGSAFAGNVHLIPLNGTIEMGVAPYITRALKEAGASGAELVIIEINTFGGRVDAASKIKDAILDSKVRTIAFVNKRAISAGALVALSCGKIVMAPGSTIGAVEPIPKSEKVVSFIKSEMVSLAQKNGKPEDIAAAMVDSDIEIKDLVEKGKLLTLSADDAVKLKFADYGATDIMQICALEGIAGPRVTKAKPAVQENIVRFLTHPTVAPILLTLGFLGFLFELKTGGWGLGGTIGLLFLALFFGGHLLAGITSIGVVMLFAAGIILLLLELFVIPGFGITGILGITATLVSVVLAFGNFERALYSLLFTIAASAILMVFLYRFLPKSSKFNRLILQKSEDVESGFVSRSVTDNIKEGDLAVALTYLRPVGKIKTGDTAIEAQSEGEFIEKDSKVIVYKIDGGTIIVRKAKEA